MRVDEGRRGSALLCGLKRRRSATAYRDGQRSAAAAAGMAGRGPRSTRQLCGFTPHRVSSGGGGEGGNGVAAFFGI